MKKSSPTFIKLVNLLNDGEYHDGTTLGKQLNITRSAVWKAIKKLESYDIQVNSIKGKGYALSEPLQLLQGSVIKKSLSNKKIDVELFESIDSTNDYLKTLGRQQNPIICIAEQQTKGRGRFNRYWHSPFAQNICLSCCYPFQKDISELTGLGFVVGLVIIESLQQYELPNGLAIKWPNDIVYQGEKLSGSLVEVQAESHGPCQTIIGLSINANLLTDKDKKITQDWSSLRKITGNYVDRNQLCSTLINTLMLYIKRFEKEGLSGFLSEWKTMDYLLNKKITLQSFNKKTTGIAKGINEHGHLLLELDDGTIKNFPSGDTSILKK